MKKTFKSLLFYSLLTFLTIGGVSASWAYAAGEASRNSVSISVNFTDWYYSENLPGGGENAEEEFDNGISHAGMIKDIINDIFNFIKIFSDFHFKNIIAY